MAFTSIPAAGSKLRGSVLSALITEVRPVTARKTANETVNNSAALQNDNELFVAAEAGATYDFTLFGMYTSGTTPDLKVGWTVPSGTTMRWGASYYDTASALALTSNLTESSTLACGGTTFNQSFIATGVIVVGSTAGLVQMQWAQNTANASDTILYVGSYLELRRTA